MNASNRYDVVIIGTGAGGGTPARVLAPSGKRVLLLERGTWLPREPQNWSTADVFVDNRYISSDTWRDRDGTAAANAIRVGEHLLDRLHAHTPAEPEQAVAKR